MSGEASEDQSSDRISFYLADDFQAATPTAGLFLGPMEIQYQELFAEVLEDGVITADERARLEKAARNLGLDLERLERLEEAMTAAYETHHRVRVVDQTATPHSTIAPLLDAGALLRGPTPVASAPPPVVRPGVPQDAELAALRAENSALKARLLALEEELVKAQAAVNVEVDLSSLDVSASSAEDPAEVWKRVRQDPTDVDAYRILSEAYDHQGNTDGKYLACAALMALGAATGPEQELVHRHRPEGLIAPKSSLSEAVWRKCVAHPEEEPITGAIFSVVAPAILVGRVTTLRRDGQLHQPPRQSKQDPKTSTIMAVRAVGWAAALLGLPVPHVFAEPEREIGFAHAAGMPPFTVVGGGALRGRTVPELAFLVGNHMAGYRGEHFVRTLFSATEDLEDLFLGALLIANPTLPIKGAKRARVEPLARAMEPLLDPSQLDALRGHYLRFAEDGGRTNLQRWGSAVDKTAARAGLALGQDLPTALSLLATTEGRLGPLSLDLLSYSTGARFLELRQTLGISVTTE
jgi:hypothetical protein